MASRHDIIHIDFQANAGKANVALQALQGEAERARLKVEGLRQQLQNARNTNMPIADIQKLEGELAKAIKESKQWQQALNNNMKGVRALDEAVKMFNKGKGSVEGMNAALSKTALNAANLQKSRSTEGSKQWKEMDALAVALQQNIARCNTATNQLVATIKSGGTTSRDTLNKAKADLQQMIDLEEKGTNAWRKYSSQLKVIEGELNRITAEEQRMAGQNAMAKVFSGQYIAMSNAEIEKLISKVKQYQATIQDPEGKGARHFKATETALLKLQSQLDKTKNSTAGLAQALKIAGAAGTANRFGSGLEAQGHKIAQAYKKTTDALNQLQQKRQTYTIIQQNGLSLTAQEQVMLAKLDAQIATTTARQERLRTEMIKVGEAQNLSTQQISQSIAVLRQQQEAVAVGSPTWKKYEAAINSLEERMKIMKGEAISLRDAMRLSSKAGGQGFTGTTKQLQLAQQAIEKAAVAAKKGSPEWQKYQQALAKVRVEMNNASMTSERMRTILSQPANAKNLNELSAAVKRAKAELDLMAGTVGKSSKAYTELAAQTKKAEIQLKQLQAQSHGTASSFDKAWSRLKTYIGLYVGAAVAMQKIMSTMSDVMTLSDKMGEVRKTTGFTADEVGRLSENLKQMDVRTPLTQLMEVSASAGQLGLKSLEDVQGFTEAANKLMIALPEMGKEAATEMMRVAIATGEVDKIRKQLQEGTIEGSSATAVAMEKIASTIDRLRASSASTAPEITDFVKRVGAVGAQSGITIDQVAALGSTVSSLGMRVEMSATALSRMIPAIRRNAFDVAKAIGMAPNALRAMFDEAGGGMNAMLAIFQHIKDAGMDEDSIEKMLGMGDMAEIMKELNQQGARAGIVFAGLSQNVDVLRTQLGVANKAYEENIAIQQEFDRMNETTAAKWERLKNQLEEAFVTDTAQRYFGGLIDMLRWIVDFMTDNLGPTLKFVSGLVKTFIVYWGVLRIGLGEGIFVKAVAGLKAMGTGLVNLITNTQAYIKYSILLKRAHTEQAKAAIEARMAQEGLNKAMIANVWTALAMAIMYVLYRLYEFATTTNELDETFRKLQADEEAAERDVNRLEASFKKTSATVATTTKRHEELTKKTEDLRKEVDEMKKSTDKSTEASEALKKKEEELTKSEDDLKKATEEMNKAKKDHSGVISEINSKYSSYLGYMLSEVTNADLVASAHLRIVSALRQELEKKRQLANQEAVEKKYEEDIKEWSQDSRDELKRLPRDVQDQIMRRRSNMMAQVSYDMQQVKGKNGQMEVVGRYVVPAIDGVGNQPKQFATEQEALAYLKKLTATIVKQETTDKGISLGKKTRTKTVKGDYLGTTKRVTQTTGKEVTAEEFVNRIWGGAYGSVSLDDGFQRLTMAELKRMQDRERQRYQDQGAVEGATTQVNQTTLKDIQANAGEIAKTLKNNKTLTDKQISEMGRQLNAVVQSSSKYEGNTADVQVYFGTGKEITLDNAAAEMLKGLDEKTRKKVIAAANKNARVGTGGTTTPTYTSGGGGWGENADASSTDYSTWDVNELVARRNQMDKFKNVLKPDTDVKTVLAEDKALMKALQNGLSADWKSVMGWYNQERLKIQQELKSERFSTNLGHWRDDPKSKRRRNPLVESDYALAELDRYYAKRKEALEKAREEENMSEELFNREAELLEQEHLKKRSDLRRTFTADNSEEEQKLVKQFREWWQGLEKKGELDNVPWATVENEWAKATAAQIGRNNLRAQQDLTQLQNIVVKHLNQIAMIVDKERPYDGITANLRKNLTEMDILLADMVQNGPTADTAKLMKEQTARLKFLLGEAENAYSLTFDDIKKKAEEKGWGDWIKALEVDEQKKQSLMQSLRNTYDAIQEAIKKESSVIKKQLDIQWNDLLPGSDMSMKGVFEKAISDLGLEGDRVKRANSLIGAGMASERVADKLAIKQMQVQLQMQETYFAMMQKIGNERVRQLRLSAAANEQEAKSLRLKEKELREQGKTSEAEIVALKAQNAERQALQDSFDAEHAQKSLNLAKTKELAEEEKQRVAIANQLEESQNRLYTELKEWGNLLASSLQSIFEASNAGNADYYNERAKMDLTGKGGPGAGTYVVIDNAGTSDAQAHYEYLDERQALEREHEIEQQNAQAEAWKKMLDDLNMKMSDQITDWLNAAAQNEALDNNTNALNTLTGAVNGLAGAMTMQNINNAMQQKSENGREENTTIERIGYEDVNPVEVPPVTKTEEQTSPFLPGVTPGISWMLTEDQLAAEQEQIDLRVQMQQEGIDKVSKAFDDHFHKQEQGSKNTDKQMVNSSQSTFAKMASAANMYGIAYQAMSNDNLDATQKFQMIALQTTGSMAMAGLEVLKAQMIADAASNTPGVLGKLWSQLGYWAAPVFAVFTGLLGGLMGLATSSITKSKSQIASVTGASAGAGRLATGMLTYGEGNVNEFTDPSTLTPGKQYNVDSADGNTYKARYMGRNAKTHITNGPEFHLVGEKGREAIIDAHTTRKLQMDDNGIWQTIQTLYNGGRIGNLRNAGRGMRAFADGNLDDFEEVGSALGTGDASMNMEQVVSLKQSIDRQNDLLEDLRTNGIKATAVFDVYGKGGLVDSYDKGKKNLTRYKESH